MILETFSLIKLRFFLKIDCAAEVEKGNHILQ